LRRNQITEGNEGNEAQKAVRVTPLRNSWTRSPAYLDRTDSVVESNHRYNAVAFHWRDEIQKTLDEFSQMP
jgi:hypothetical protein